MTQAAHLERILVDPDLLRLSVIFLAALSVGGIAYVLVMPYLSGERKTDKRFASVSQGKNVSAGGGALPESANMRKKQVFHLMNRKWNIFLENYSCYVGNVGLWDLLMRQRCYLSSLGKHQPQNKETICSTNTMDWEQAFSGG